ncbi:tetratricopeptide repeat protein [Merismopedia glauca]|uniref:Tfp pilus assembly protein PilF n=1 Tax=Merismopedia glauca CCAP 1448/3 TaxID=1296344 RepID=A0A2T1C6F5_9CYAN|nr:tetratricopeptide repeat protein [Merismopedia glauca]PSB03814.1 Tfp pilus assembly protein PilF [Merismopedia glauca CCAP 1448/3]
MSLNRNRSIITLILGLIALGLLGFYTIPTIAAAWGQNQDSNRSDSTSETTALADLGKAYEQILQREPSSREALRGLVEIKLQQGDLRGSVAFLERLVTLSPDRPDYAVLLAQAKQKLGDREGAVQVYRTVLATQPAQINALQGLVNLLLQEKGPEAAIGVLQDSLKKINQAPQTDLNQVTSVQLLLAQIYANQERYPEAVAVYDAAITVNSKDFRPVLAKALVLENIGRPVEAKPLFTKAIALAPPEYKDQVKKMAASPDQQSLTPTPTPTGK